MPKTRKPARLKPLKTMKVFCEGEKTEPSYIKAYIAETAKDGRRSVVEVQKTDKNTAAQLVAEAIKAKKSINAMPNDEVWVVYDRESIAKYPESIHASAYNDAIKAGVKVALNSVCFEYWLLLHYQVTAAPYSSYDDLVNKSSLKADFRKDTGVDYDKSSSMIFSLTKNHIDQAKTRSLSVNANAKAVAARGKDKPYMLNPYVGFVNLLKAIDEFK